MGKKNMLSSFLSSSHSLPISIQNGSLIQYCSLHRGNYITFLDTTPSLQAKVDKVFRLLESSDSLKVAVHSVHFNTPCE